MSTRTRSPATHRGADRNALSPGRHDPERWANNFVVQRKRNDGATPDHIPDIVNEVVESPGQPLDDVTRRLMEHRLGSVAAGGGRLDFTPPARGRGIEPADTPQEWQARQVAAWMSREAGNAAASPPRGGVDLSSVRVHTDSKAQASARLVSAEAYTVRNNIVFGSGAYAPRTPAGQALMGHELVHVLQQRQAGTAMTGPVQRVGIIEKISRFFGGGTFSEQELADYLKLLETTRKIEDNYDSDNKAREVVRRWKAGDPKFAVLTIPIRVLLIQEMASGYLSDGDQKGILSLLGEALPSERFFMLPKIDIEQLKRRFDGDNRKALDGILDSQETGSMSLGDEWNVAGVKQILTRQGDAPIIKVIADHGIRIFRFTTAIERWKLDNGTEQDEDMLGLKGITMPDGKEIGLRKSLSNAQAATTLFHELNHVISPAPDYIDQEVQVRVAEENFRFRHGMPPTKPRYRNPDGSVNIPFIRSEVTGNQNYQPTGKERISLKFVDKQDVPGWVNP